MKNGMSSRSASTGNEKGKTRKSMPVSDRDVEDYLACPTKTYLRASNVVPSGPELAEYRKRMTGIFALLSVRR